MMKIWHVYPTEYGQKLIPTWDVANAFIVYANTARQARFLASKRAGDEGAILWTNSTYSFCVLVGRTLREENQQVLLRDFSNG